MHTLADIYCTHTHTHTPQLPGIDEILGVVVVLVGRAMAHIDSGVEISAKDLSHSRISAPPIAHSLWYGTDATPRRHPCEPFDSGRLPDAPARSTGRPIAAGAEAIEWAETV